MAKKPAKPTPKPAAKAKKPRAKTNPSVTPAKQRGNRSVRPNGRPTVMPKVKDKLLALLALGVSIDAACGEAGISTSMFYRWMQKGEDAAALHLEGYDLTPEETGYREFREDAIRAEHRMEVDIIRELRKRFPDEETRNLIELMGRKARRWARNDTVNVKHSGGVTVDVLQRYGETVAELLRGVLGDLGLSAEQRELAPVVVKDWMARLTAKEPV